MRLWSKLFLLQFLLNLWLAAFWLSVSLSEPQSAILALAAFVHVGIAGFTFHWALVAHTNGD